MNTLSSSERARAFKKKPTDRPRGDRLVPRSSHQNSPSVRHAIEAMIKGTGSRSREVAEDAFYAGARNRGEYRRRRTCSTVEGSVRGMAFMRSAGRGVLVPDQPSEWVEQSGLIGMQL